MAKNKVTPRKSEKQTQLAVEAPRTARELLRLGYVYTGGDQFVDGRFVPGNENVMDWEGETEWTLDRDDGRGDLPHVVHTRVKARFEFSGIMPDKE